MIILKVIGGLGNQLFEIAFARMLSLEFNEEIYLDCSVYNNYKIRKFSLSNFIIYDFVKDIEDLKISTTNRIKLKMTQKIYHVYQKIVTIATKGDVIGKSAYEFLSRRGLYYNFDTYYYKPVLTNKTVKNLYGYFQSEKYFEKYKEQISEELRVKTIPTNAEKKLLEEIKSFTSVAVSMRLGDDYIKLDKLNICTKKFYYEAMDYIHENVENAVFYIFSDDIERAKRQFKFKYPVRYIEGFKDYESLRLMYTCKHFVISNSSFSWWGAYLSDYKNKIVVAPSKWYRYQSKTPDIYYDSMTTINV